MFLFLHVPLPDNAFYIHQTVHSMVIPVVTIASTYAKLGGNSCSWYRHEVCLWSSMLNNIRVVGTSDKTSVVTVQTVSELHVLVLV